MEESRHKSWIPHGFDYRSGPELTRLQRYTEQFRQITSAAGFAEIVPPLLDYEAALRLPGDLSFTVKDRRGERLALRSDMTIQIIKAVANGRLAPSGEGVWQVSYCQPIFRDSSWGQGHRREIMQAGVEIIETGKAVDPAALLQLALRVLRELGSKVRILYGDSRVVEAMLRPWPEALRGDLRSALQLRDVSLIRQILNGDHSPAAEILYRLPFLFGGRERLSELMQLTSDPGVKAYLKEAEQVYTEEIVYDFALIRPLPYYTGPIFEGYMEGSREEILAGGVYDALFGNFSHGKASCAGFAINMGEIVSPDGKSI
ncbi:MAG: ATP phosphoribosyltransferase regulatory subunit [Spirochaetales bacterium]|nr:ATP phosphoribosyltransferase regulatory subunit [Spirochaetales bacterium]